MSAATSVVSPARTGRRVPVYAGCDRVVPPTAAAPVPGPGEGGHSGRLRMRRRALVRTAFGLPAAVPTATACARPGPLSLTAPVHARTHTTRRHALACAAPCRTTPSPTRKAAS